MVISGPKIKRVLKNGGFLNFCDEIASSEKKNKNKNQASVHLLNFAKLSYATDLFALLPGGG